MKLKDIIKKKKLGIKNTTTEKKECLWWAHQQVGHDQGMNQWVKDMPMETSQIKRQREKNLRGVKKHKTEHTI